MTSISARDGPASGDAHTQMMMIVAASQGAREVSGCGPICTTAPYMDQLVSSSSGLFNPAFSFAPSTMPVVHASAPDSSRQTGNDGSSTYSSCTGYTIVTTTATADFPPPAIAAIPAPVPVPVPVSPLYKVPSTTTGNLSTDCLASGSIQPWMGSAGSQCWTLADMILPAQPMAGAPAAAIASIPSYGISQPPRMAVPLSCSPQGSIGMAQTRLPW